MKPISVVSPATPTFSLDYDKSPGPLAKAIRGTAALLQIPTLQAMDAVSGGGIVDQGAKAR